MIRRGGLLGAASLLLGLAFSAVALAAAPEYKFDSTDSFVRFISVKKGSVAEVGGFSRFAGDIDTDGKFTLSVDLTSVDTAIEIRDQRLRDEFFEVKDFPASTITGKVDLVVVNGLEVGEAATTSVEATVDLHGATQQLEAELSVTRLRDGVIRVSTVNPIILSLEQLGLIPGMQTLQQLAGLSSINQVVPVYFSLTLRDAD